MHLEGHSHESHNQAPHRASIATHPSSQGLTSHHDHDEIKAKRQSMHSEAKTHHSDDDDDDASSEGSKSTGQHTHQHEHHHHHHHHRASIDANTQSRMSNTFGDHHHHSHVHFKEKKSMAHIPPLSPVPKPTSRASDGYHLHPQEDLARASWTTASFTEVPGALDELTSQHHPSSSKTSGSIDLSDHDTKKTSLEHNSATDLHSILVKHGEEYGSILTKYLRPTMTDEGTQAGIPSWDWLTRLEQMLIHFFLMVFESSNDSSKLILEMMSTEAGVQIEEIFQLLLKAEPDMYKELGHLVTLAEKWLIHWRGDSEERHKALEYVRLYMQGVKDKNYYMLPVQVRLHKLGAFIAGLKIMGKDAPDSGPLPPVRFPAYKIHRVPSVPENQLRLNSPRVKPATHFSHVVANILCGRPCNDPLPKAEVYADTLGRNVFKNTLHGDKEFKTYTDKKYGKLYLKTELFSKEFSRQESLGMEYGSGDAEIGIADRADCVENVHCWIPKYRKSYVNTLKDEGCEVLAKADYDKGIKVKELRIAKGKLGAVHDIHTHKATMKNVKPKKLYDWVRGPDGKVHRRVVGSYTELGRATSMGRLGGTADDRKMIGRRGHGAGGKKGMKGGAYQKAVSDTRLGRRSYDTRKTQTTRASKSRYTNRSRERSRDRLGGKDTSRSVKSKKLNTALNAYKVDGISLDGSGDSGQENSFAGTRREKKAAGTATDEKYSKKVGTGQQKGKGEANKFGPDYHGPSHYKPHQRDPTKESRGVGGGAGSRHGAHGAHGAHGTHHGHGHHEHGRHSGDGKNGSFVSIFDKKHGKNANQDHRRRTFNKSFKNRFSMTDEWGGEGYSNWSPRGSDFFSLDKEKGHKKDDQQLLTINQCWEKASKLFKKPSKALVIPPAENLMLYLEKKYPRCRWARGEPIATRNYPNGSTFVAQYRNGSSKVYYPNGGLAVAISAPSPLSSQILIVRDPSDHVFFFDKALLAELNSAGKGIIYAEDGVIKAQYSAIGGFKMDNLDKGQRWHWNQGGQRMLLKLNKYMSLRISDQDKIFLNYFGNHRGFLVNVASGHEVILMNPTSKSTRVDPIMQELKNLIRPKTMEDTFDYIRGKSNPRPTLGFVDKAKHFANADENLMRLLESDNPQDNVNYSADEHQSNLYDTFSKNFGGGGNFVNYTDNFPDYATVNRDACVVNAFPVTCYNTI